MKLLHFDFQIFFYCFFIWNATTKKCEHTVAVAEKYGKLADLITWYKRSKSGASIIKTALDGAPKTAGKKPRTITKDRIAKDNLQLCLWTF